MFPRLYRNARLVKLVASNHVRMNNHKKVVVITGCTGTLARAFSQLYQNKYRIIGISREGTPTHGMEVIQGNVSESVGGIVKELRSLTDRVDVLINNAFYIKHKAMEQFSREEMLAHFETNVVAPVDLTNALLAEFWNTTIEENRRNNRVVVNVSSVSGIYDFFGRGHSFYSASKAALNTISRYQASELSIYGIRANVIAPCTFPDLISTESVVLGIEELIASEDSGIIRVLERKSHPKNEISLLTEHLTFQDIEISLAPFKHVRVPNFLKRETYDAFCEIFNAVLGRGLSESVRHAQFSLFGEYDAYYWMIPAEIREPLNLLYSLDWKDFFSELFDVPLTGDVVAEFHHHQPGSKNGTPHNDYNLCCFTDERLPNGINPWYYHCNYNPERNDMTTGKVFARMRSVAIILYLNNEEWRNEDGGETALYYTDLNLDRAVLVPPINNTLLAFEVTPHSYHAFRQNVRSDRNSIIMWLHSSVEEKLARHGQTPPVV